MINMKNLVNLSNKELRQINAGESGWYWVIYAAGQAYYYAKRGYEIGYGGGTSHGHSAG